MKILYCLEKTRLSEQACRSQMQRRIPTKPWRKPSTDSEMGDRTSGKPSEGQREGTEDGECKCPHCGGRFTSKAGLIQHQLMHIKEEARPEAPAAASHLNRTLSNDPLSEEASHRPIEPKDEPRLQRITPVQKNPDLKELMHPTMAHCKSPKTTEDSVVSSAWKADDGLHTRDALCTCHACQAYYTQSSEIVEHVNEQKGECKIETHPQDINPKSELCTECGEGFNLNADLHAHVQTHGGKGQCMYEEYAKSSTIILCTEKDQEEQAEEKIWTDPEYGKGFREHCFGSDQTEELHCTCNQCKKSFSTKSELLSHITTHPSGKLYQCTAYGKLFTVRAQLLTHPGINSYRCKTCGKCFASKSSLGRHERLHTGEKPYGCAQCGQAFSARSTLKVHQKIHTGVKAYTCTACEKSFTLRSALLRHAKAHTGEGQGQKGSLSKRRFHAHVRNPTAEKAFSCDTCGACFTAQTLLERHREVHAEEKPYICMDCGKTFAKHDSVLVHKRRFHTGIKPFVCSDCEKSFILRSQLLVHMRSHTGEKPYMCDECGKCFTSASTLGGHKKIHSSQKIYPCDICGKSFCGRPALVRHKRTHSLLVHAKTPAVEKMHECDTCGKRFSGKPDLTRHLRIHTGEKPYTCETCGNSFSLRSTLVRHERTHAK